MNGGSSYESRTAHPHTGRRRIAAGDICRGAVDITAR